MARRGPGRPRPLAWLVLAVAVAIPAAANPPVGAGDTRATTTRLDVVFTLDGANPAQWRACHPSCVRADAAEGTSVRFATVDDPVSTRFLLRGAEPVVDPQRLRFTAGPGEDPGARTVTFQAELPAHGVRLVKSFEVARDGYLTVMTVSVQGANAVAFARGRRAELELQPGRDLFSPSAAGFAAMLDRVERVMVAGGAARAIPDGERAPWATRAGDWAGLRNRFWAIVVSPGEPSTLAPRPGPGLVFTTDEPGRTSWRYTWYSGPIERQALVGADPALDRLRLSGLWSWLRGPSLALQWLLGTLRWAFGNAGVAIVALALVVKILLLPLTLVAERLQEQVNATQARLQPGIEAIHAAHRGEERARRTLALYREHGVHPLYTLKSLFGLLIQVPVFVAVFDMLAEDFGLHRVAFLWIADLSRPDELLHLPACLPFFGCHLNLLPFLMGAASLAGLLRYRSGLTPSLARRQRRNLAGMTALFFLLFYTFPAGMVLYWTSANAAQLLVQELRQRLGRPA